MKRFSLGFSLSFLLHGLLVLSALSMGSFVPTLGKPVVIDLTLVQQEAHSSFKKTVPVPRVQHETPPALEKMVQLPPPQKQIVPRSVKAAVPQPQKTVELQSPVAVEPLIAPVEPIAMNVPKPVVIPKAIEEETHVDPVALVTAEVVPATASYGTEESMESQEEEPVVTAHQVYLKKHFQYIKETIQKEICYPGIARKMGWEGKVVVSFVVKENGDIEDMKIVQSSGYQALDKNAMTTIKKAAPFPSPPITAEVIIPVTYCLG